MNVIWSHDAEYTWHDSQGETTLTRNGVPCGRIVKTQPELSAFVSPLGRPEVSITPDRLLQSKDIRSDLRFAIMMVEGIAKVFFGDLRGYWINPETIEAVLGSGKFTLEDFICYLVREGVGSPIIETDHTLSAMAQTDVDS